MLAVPICLPHFLSGRETAFGTVTYKTQSKQAYEMRRGRTAASSPARRLYERRITFQLALVSRISPVKGRSGWLAGFTSSGFCSVLTAFTSSW